MGINFDHLNVKIDSPKKLKNLFYNTNEFMTNRLNDTDVNDCLNWFLKSMKKYKLLLTIMDLYNTNSSTYKEEMIKNLSMYSHKTILKIIDEALSKKYIVYKTNNGSNDYKKKLIKPSTELLIAYLNWNIKHIFNYSNAIKKIVK